jgi:phosphohistidine phosphatase
MKTLYLVRHAKSSWNIVGIDDFDRPLNERGKQDAPEMAKRLKKRNNKIDLLLSSPAKRAYKTAKYFAEAFDIKKGEIVLVDRLYHASVSTFLETISEIKDKYDSVVIFSHNPGITEFANILTNVHIDDMPTCSVFAVQIETGHWKDFFKSEKKFLFFDYPKNPLC